MAKFDPSQIAEPRPLNPSIKKFETGDYVHVATPCAKFCADLHWGFLGKGVKYYRNFFYFHIPFLMASLQVRPVDGFLCTIAQMMAASRMGQTFSGMKIQN